MQNIEGLYSNLAALINQREEEGRLAISAEDLIKHIKEEVDVYSASIDWYVKTILRQAVEISLWQKGYRSVIKGNGMFVNVQNCTKPEYLARLFNNAKLTERQKQQIVNMIKRKISEVGMPGQMSMDFDTGTIIEDITEEQLMAMLIEDATGDDDK